MHIIESLERDETWVLPRASIQVSFLPHVGACSLCLSVAGSAKIHHKNGSSGIVNIHHSMVCEIVLKYRRSLAVP
jgi:hypothetical protein